MIKQTLQEIGLTESEAKVYLALLETGQATTGKIIDKAQISSGKIYEILDKLINKGLASFIIKNKTKYFQATSPNRILDYVHKKQDEMKLKEQSIKTQLPNLLLLNKKENNNQITLYTGFKGIHSAIYEALENLSSKDKIQTMGVTSNKNEKFNLMWQAWHKKRINKKISCQILFSKDNSEYYKSFKNMKLTQVKNIEGITPSAIDIVGNQTLIFTYKNQPSCLQIKNPEITQSFKIFFETLWQSTK
ncbi:MAG: hypothetical protein KJ592_03120 [Nanoarchaeota archaeon]|nr:hypothetical protein [Nanoarchaeota archaeon]